MCASMFLQALCRDVAGLQRTFFGPHKDTEEGLEIETAAEKAVLCLNTLHNSNKHCFSAWWATRSCAVE